MNRTTCQAPPRCGRAFAAAVCLAAACALAPPISAQQPSPATQKVAQLAAKADQLVEKGQIFEAISALSQAVKLAPQRADLRMKLAELEKKRGMWLRSAEQYRAVLAANPTSVEAHLGYGELLLADYQFRAAAQEFKTLLAQHPPHHESDRAMAGLGSSLYGMEEYEEAGEVFGKLQKEHPEDPTALAYTNLVKRRLGDLDGAIEGWRLYLQERPGMARAEALKAEAEALRGAIVHQRQIVASDPNDARARLKLGEVLERKPDPAGALDAYQNAARLDPKNPEIQFRLGCALRDAGRCADAIPHLKKLAKADDYKVIGAYNLAYCARHTDNPDLEVAAWNEVLETNHADKFAYRKYVAALQRAGKVDQEVKVLQKGISARPTDPLPRIQYGVLVGAMGNWEEEFRALLDAVALEPNDPYATAELVRALWSHPEAVDGLMKEVAAAEPDHPLSSSRVFRESALDSATGKTDEAAKLLEAYLKEHQDDARALVALAFNRLAPGGPPEKVLELLEQAKKAEPDYFYARLQLAILLESMARYDAAVAEAVEALKLRPDDPYALTILGISLRGRGGDADLKNARATLRRALTIDPMDGSGTARLILAKVSWQLGLEDQARRTLKGDLPVDPEDLYDLAWSYLRANYRDRQFNGQNWNVWKDRFRGTLKTRADALSAISVMLASLDDRDTRLRSYNQTVNVYFTSRALDVQRDPQGRSELTSKTVKTATLDENVGYVAVTNMADPKLVKEVEGAVSDMKHRDGVILDLRGNQGGSEQEVQRITSMLVPSGTPTGTVVTPQTKTKREVQSPKAPELPKKPIVVLVDKNTASSAEALAGALKESKRAVVVGSRTYGKAGIQIPHLLPDGTTLLVAVAENGDLSGASYSGVGVEPDVELPHASATEPPSSDEALKKAEDILRRVRDERKGVTRERGKEDEKKHE